jgi:hypothetical protein
MKKGDIVLVVDGSYFLVIRGGKPEPYTELQMHNRQFKVIEVNMKLPAANPFPEPKFNDTIIQALDNNETVFIQERFLKPASLFSCMSMEDKRDLLRFIRVFREMGCPPKKHHRLGEVSCFNCTTCWEAALEREIG